MVEHPALIKAKHTRQEVIQNMVYLAKELSEKGGRGEKELARDLMIHAHKLPPVQSKHEAWVKALLRAKSEGNERQQPEPTKTPQTGIKPPPTKGVER